MQLFQSEGRYRYGCVMFFFFQAKDGIRSLVRSRGLGDVYKRQGEVPGMLAAELRQQGITSDKISAPHDEQRSIDELSLIHI